MHYYRCVPVSSSALSQTDIRSVSELDQPLPSVSLQSEKVDRSFFREKEIQSALTVCLKSSLGWFVAGYLSRRHGPVAKTHFKPNLSVHTFCVPGIIKLEYRRMSRTVRSSSNNANICCYIKGGSAASWWKNLVFHTVIESEAPRRRPVNITSHSHIPTHAASDEKAGRKNSTALL